MFASSLRNFDAVTTITHRIASHRIAVEIYQSNRIGAWNTRESHKFTTMDPPPPPSEAPPPPPPETTFLPPAPSDHAPPPPAEDLGPEMPPKKKGWGGTTKPKSQPLSIEDILAKKKAADEAAAKVRQTHPIQAPFTLNLYSQYAFREISTGRHSTITCSHLTEVINLEAFMDM